MKFLNSLQFNPFIKRVANVAMIALVVSTLVPGLSIAAKKTTVTICHATNSDANPYNIQNPAADADVGGHDGHNGPIWFDGIDVAWGDIIPPFDYDSGSYLGKNWTTDGQAIYNNDCNIPAAPPSTGSLTVNKVTVGGDGTFDFSGDNGIGDFQISTENSTGSQTFLNLNPNFYIITEGALPDGWAQTGNTCDDNDGGITVVAGQEANCTITNTFTQPQGVTINAHKIVCNLESQLPNWGDGSGPDTITATTAQDFVDASDQQCHFQEGWNFQWGPEGATEPDGSDTFTGPADSPWTTFGPTDGNGLATASLSAEEINGSDHLWFREELQPGYIPFTFHTNGDTNSDNVSAEVYCGTDVLNYDNYDRIDGIQADGVYNCVAFNVLSEQQITSSINGFKYNDLNGNGELDEGEVGLAGWTIYLDLDANGELNGDEPSFVTLEDGSFSFNDLPSGPYIIREVMQDGWTQTGAPGVGDDGAIVLGSTASYGNNFFNQIACDAQLEMIADGGFEEPVVENDAQWDVFGLPTSGWDGSWVNPNENQPMMELQRGVNGWAAHSGDQYTELDSDQDGPSGSMNGEDGLIRLNQNLTTVAGRTYNVNFWTSPRPGLGTDENVTEVWWNGSLQDTITEDGSANSNTVWTLHTYSFVATGTSTELAFVGGGTPDSLGAFLDDVSVMADCSQETPKGSITGRKWNDLDGDGQWGEENPMNGVTIKLYSGETLVDTVITHFIGDMGDGYYHFGGLEYGTYTVCEVEPSGWTQTFPVDPNCYTIVINGETPDVVGKNFGNHQNPQDGGGDDTCEATLSGKVFKDLNEDGIWQDGEPALENWTLYLDLNNDDQWNVGEPVTTSDADGLYSFGVIAPGTYTVREQIQSGWSLVYPGVDQDGEYLVTVNCSLEVPVDLHILAVDSNGTDVNFANKLNPTTNNGGGGGGGGPTDNGGGSTPNNPSTPGEVAGDQIVANPPAGEVLGEQLPVTGQPVGFALILLLGGYFAYQLLTKRSVKQED